MLRKILLILFIAGLTVVSLSLEYRSSAGFPSECQVERVCPPDTKPPCEKYICPDADMR